MGLNEQAEITSEVILYGAVPTACISVDSQARRGLFLPWRRLTLTLLPSIAVLQPGCGEVRSRMAFLAPSNDRQCISEVKDLPQLQSLVAYPLISTCLSWPELATLGSTLLQTIEQQWQAYRRLVKYGMEQRSANSEKTRAIRLIRMVSISMLVLFWQDE